MVFSASKLRIKQEGKRRCFQITLYFIFISAISSFMFLYSVQLKEYWNMSIRLIKPFILTYVDDNLIQEGFLVYSESCKIPDIDPFHPSISHLIERSDPINCSDSETFTWTEENFLFLDVEAVAAKGTDNFKCCFKVIYRDEQQKLARSYRFGDECRVIGDKTLIKDEFITVTCSLPNGTVFYQNFHSFIHDKPDVESRCKNVMNATDKYSVLIIGIDAMSRINMHRQLNATFSYLNEYLDAIEMFGFNKVGDNTFPNLVPLLSGYAEQELPKVCWNSSDFPLDECNFVWKLFQKHGYRTLYAEDTPHIASFDYMKEGFNHQPTDYYFQNFMMAFEDTLGRDKRLNCHRCVGTISETEAVLQWVEKFAKHFKDDPYFAFAWINSLTHDYLNSGSSADHIYENFFRRLHDSRSLSNTIIIVMGDHGMRWGEIRSTYIGRLEERLPMFLLVLPPNFKSNHPSAALALQKNAHRLVTPFDIYITLETIARSGKNQIEIPIESINMLQNNRSRSLFHPISINRSCKDANIDEHWCTCQMSEDVNLNSTDVQIVSLLLVNEVNMMLKNHASVCAVLFLDSIAQARSWNPLSAANDKNAVQIYTVVIKTKPGAAVFEATARFNPVVLNFSVLGTISRLNVYGNQSACVQDAILKKYCYCL